MINAARTGPKKHLLVALALSAALATVALHERDQAVTPALIAESSRTSNPDPASVPETVKQQLLRERLARPEVPAVRGPGGDVPLSGFNEPTIAVNPLDPTNIAYASLFELRVSTDRGETWQDPLFAEEIVDGGGLCGDSSVAFDSQGRLFWSYLTCPSSGTNILVARCDPLTGAILPGYPVNMSAAAGASGNDGYNNDKEWLAADFHNGSPFQDRLYMVWTWRMLNGNLRTLTSFSSDQGMTWSTYLRIDLSQFVEGEKGPTHISVAPNGDVYASYHSVPPGGLGQVFVLRSTDGGVTFPQKSQPFTDGEAGITENLGPWPRIPGAKFLLTGSWQPWVLADANVPGRVYAIANDDPDAIEGSGDPADVMIAISTDSGQTWSSPTRIDSGPAGTLQVMPTAAVDQVTGTIAVSYFDNRSGMVNSSGDDLLDLYATYSTDGGASFAIDFPISDAPFDPVAGAACYAGCGITWWGVWGLTGSDVFAVSLSGTAHYDGVDWVSEGAQGPYTAISGTSGSNIFAVGTDGHIAHYDGVTWSEQVSGTTWTLRGVWAEPGGDIIAVGRGGTILRSDGSGAWTADSSGTTQELRSVWGSAGDDVFAVGFGGTILHFDGTSWSSQSSGATGPILGVWGSSGTDVFAVLLLKEVRHYDGTSWSLHADLGNTVLTCVGGTGPEDVYAAGDQFVYRWDGNAWTKISGLGGLAIWVDAPDDIFVTGSSGLIRHWNGIDWENQDNPGNPVDPVLRIGEYNGIAVADAGIYAVWCGNWPAGGPPESQQAMFDLNPLGSTGAPDVGAVASGLRLDLPTPSPFGWSTSIGYSLPTPARTQLAVYDVQGRRIATLVDAAQGPGPHTANWDGRNAAGARAASGIYFIRLEANGEVSTRRVALRR